MTHGKQGFYADNGRFFWVQISYGRRVHRQMKKTLQRGRNRPKAMVLSPASYLPGTRDDMVRGHIPESCIRGSICEPARGVSTPNSTLTPVTDGVPLNIVPLYHIRVP